MKRTTNANSRDARNSREFYNRREANNSMDASSSSDARTVGMPIESFVWRHLVWATEFIIGPCNSVYLE